MAAERVIDYALISIQLKLKTPCLNIVTGILKGYDQLLNLVMDDIEEHLRGEPFVAPLLIECTALIYSTGDGNDRQIPVQMKCWSQSKHDR